MKNPPILVAVLGFFAALAGFGFIFFGVSAIGFDWFGALGDLPAFERVGLWGWLAIITGVIWLLVALGLWSLQPWARLFAMIMAGIGLIEAFLAFVQFPGTGIAFGMALMPGVVLWYLSTSEVKEAFGVAPAAAPAPAAAAAAPAPVTAAPEPAPALPAAAAPLGVAAVVAAASDDATDPEPAIDPEPAPAAAPLATAAVAPEAAPAEPAAPHAASSGHHRPVEDVEGIGPAYGEKLVAAGVRTTDELLTTGATRHGREQLAAATGISGHLLLEWVNNADLMRVPGVGPQYSDLLEAAGVDSPAELAQRNPANLARTFQEVVAARPGTVRRIPTEAEVSEWIEGAKALPKVVEH